MKRVLFIDNWSQGKRFVEPVVKEFQSNNYYCYYLHADSYYLNKTFKNLEKITDLSYEDHDISEYEDSLYLALRKIKPNVIIFISIHGIFQRWANFIAEVLEIPCCFFMHGIRIPSPRKMSNRSFFYIIKRALFYHGQFFLFCKDLLRMRGVAPRMTSSLLRFYVELIFHNHRFTNSPKNNMGLNYRLMFVNSRKDIDYFRSNYPLSSTTEFIISGNVSALEPAIRSFNIECSKDYILFVSQPGLLDYDDYFRTIVFFNKLFKGTEFRFLFRPHPRDDKNFVAQLQNDDVLISSDSSDIDFARSCAAIGINSAMLLGFIYLGMPIIQISDGVNPELCSMFEYKRSIYYNLNATENQESIIERLRDLVTCCPNVDGEKTPSRIIYEGIVNSNYIN